MSDRLREDLVASLAARRELGPDFDPAVVESIADRIVAEIDERADRQRTGRRHDLATVVVALGSISLALGVPSATAQLPAAASLLLSLVAWVAIVAINVVYARAGTPGTRTWSGRR